MLLSYASAWPNLDAVPLERTNTLAVLKLVAYSSGTAYTVQPRDAP